MPTYEYECLECKNRFEAFQSIKEDPLEKCDKCGGKVKKLISAGAGIIFKGSGFYVTDYKNSSGSGSNGNGKKNKTADNAKTESSASAATTASTTATETKSSSSETKTASS